MCNALSFQHFAIEKSVVIHLPFSSFLFKRNWFYPWRRNCMFANIISQKQNTWQPVCAISILWRHFINMPSDDTSSPSSFLFDNDSRSIFCRVEYERMSNFQRDFLPCVASMFILFHLIRYPCCLLVIWFLAGDPYIKYSLSNTEFRPISTGKWQKQTKFSFHVQTTMQFKTSMWLLSLRKN